MWRDMAKNEQRTEAVRGEARQGLREGDASRNACVRG